MRTRIASIRLLTVALLCALLVTACQGTNGTNGGNGGNGNGGDDIPADDTCPDECQNLHPPGPPSDGSSNSWIQVRASAYGTGGGIMVSVDVNGPHDEGSSYSNVGKVRVWAGTGDRPADTGERPDDDDTRVQSRAGYNIDTYRWAGSTIVQTPATADTVWTYVEVTLDPATSGDPEGVFSFWEVWDADTPAAGWGHPEAY